MENSWVLLAFLTLIMWGLGGFFVKIATTHLPPKSVYIYQAIGALIVIIAAFIIFGKPEVNQTGIIFAVLTGIVGTLGALLFIFAISKGKSSVVVTATALYPLITILLAFLILKEIITIKQGIGMVFALIAMVLFTL